ncbi:methyltransferase [Tetraselmis virus 1]|uniref:Methyltransferase n=1 Tax=Tetraselmis virus 1 TaxID=2060617 RepID=A0A2P0VNV5_9VIRU|nr:methyltransferase [Tetraselmis virus 1]AUF82583.1 methyltransferase [Tetraselmis virus 1]
MNHLGGHANVCNLDIGVLKWIKSMNMNSFLDVGCGTGEMIIAADKEGLSSWGIDGDTEVKRNTDKVTIVDFSKESIPDTLMKNSWDVIYSTEFLEHITEKDFDERCSSVFKRAKQMIIITAAPIGWGGHHHVNENTHEYWLKKFNELGYEHDIVLTKMLRESSTMNTNRKKQKQFMKHRGLVFVPMKKDTLITQYAEIEDVKNNVFQKKTKRLFKSYIPAVKRII